MPRRNHKRARGRQRSKRIRMMEDLGKFEGYGKYLELKKGDRRRANSKPQESSEVGCERYGEQESGDIGWIGDRRWSSCDAYSGCKSYTKGDRVAGAEEGRTGYGSSDHGGNREDRLETVCAGDGDWSYFGRLYSAELQRESQAKRSAGSGLLSVGSSSQGLSE